MHCRIERLDKFASRGGARPPHSFAERDVATESSRPRVASPAETSALGREEITLTS